MTVTADYVYLASQSPRRRELLEQIGVAYQMLLPSPQEDSEAIEALRLGEAPDRYVRRVVHAKLDAARARRLARGLAAAPILCADTTVARGGQILGKPTDAQEAAHMLARLSGRTHRVLTAVALSHGRDDRKTRCAISVSRVTFARLDPRDIDQYVARGDSLDKAGGYGIQGAAAAFIRKIEGSYSGIMGLPLFEVSRLLDGLVRFER